MSQCLRHWSQDCIVFLCKSREWHTYSEIALGIFEVNLCWIYTLQVASLALLASVIGCSLHLYWSGTQRFGKLSGVHFSTAQYRSLFKDLVSSRHDICIQLSQCHPKATCGLVPCWMHDGAGLHFNPDMLLEPGACTSLQPGGVTQPGGATQPGGGAYLAAINPEGIQVQYTETHWKVVQPGAGGKPAKLLLVKGDCLIYTLHIHPYTTTV